ncbi:DMT family transporter [Rummeliibacillus pycnus]|uniref:DMT family transporter n=1 Tax=Rummeliibacillus pycnus TaxID=101070 RepID=UPI000C9984F2|nr:multidrug efflux SMR transporter [Rummeliibacillus pycnus]
MAWLAIITAGLCEVFGVTMMNRWQNEKKFSMIVWLIVSFALSLALLSYAMNSVPMSTAYAVWTGLGASGGALIGMIFFGESKNWKRILFITMILVSAVGLKLIS